jgi:hypothetical protein
MPDVSFPSISDGLKALGLSRSWGYSLISSGDIITVNIAGRARIDMERTIAKIRGGN